ncbi:transcriptional regulatory protein rprY [Aquipluma nitroreducens]|uniref:Transcriptional regulatory protein rprY n=1 Tax=Aquipluma nitroreducens TaxID=2010828 RepID=A0A5K7S746_9BACT|nr:response regulator transcription factor [Aquipluma nitroreducens]BBE17383.1 transcriptional regulatory protein rprY [Aquipluma nitroreducens]
MEKKVKLLLAEDDENLGLLLKEYLIAKGYETDLYSDGELAYKGFTKNQPYNLCILDIMMPKKDGISLAKDIRLLNMDVPIIFLTAKNMKEDVLEGFKIGADDYITKPFSMEELIFRIEAIMRRVSQDNNSHEDAVYQLGIYTFDSRKQILTGGEEDEVKLTTKEAELLRLLCNNANKVLERNFALKTIWIDDNYFNARSMDVYITKLRKHLKDDPKVEIINVHGKGYKLIM